MRCAAGTTADVTIAIYSSGSVLAQQLLFRSTPFGDLTPLIDAYFDTSVGAKREPESYRRIAERLGQAAGARCLFISDVPAELAAARAGRASGPSCAYGPGTPRPDDAESIRDFNGIV